MATANVQHVMGSGAREKGRTGEGGMRRAHSWRETQDTAVPSWADFIVAQIMHTHLKDLNFEVVDRRRVPLAARVYGLRREHRRGAHVIREHLHQKIHVAELGRQGRAHHVVRARHDLSNGYKGYKGYKQKRTKR